MLTGIVICSVVYLAGICISWRVFEFYKMNEFSAKDWNQLSYDEIHNRQHSEHFLIAMMLLVFWPIVTVMVVYWWIRAKYTDYRIKHSTEEWD